MPWSHIWPEIYDGLSTNWEANIVRRLSYGVLKTTAYLKQWHRLRVSSRCAACRAIATLSHVFCTRTIAPPVWAWVFQLLSLFYSTPVDFTSRLAFFKLGLPQGTKFLRASALSHVIITLNELWAARNQCTFEGQDSAAPTVINKIKHGCVPAETQPDFNSQQAFLN